MREAVCWRYNLETMSIADRKQLKRFEYHVLPELPEELRAIYQKLTYREKLFIPYYFESESLTATAIKAGYIHKHASSRGCEAKARVKPILDYIDKELLNRQIADKPWAQLISREMVLEKLARVFLTDIGDLEDYEEAKRTGAISAAKEVSVIEIENPATGEKVLKRVVTKMVDQKAVGALICDIMGYKEPAKKEISGPGGQPLQPPVINVHQYSIQSPLKNKQLGEGSVINVKATAVPADKVAR